MSQYEDLGFYGVYLVPFLPHAGISQPQVEFSRMSCKHLQTRGPKTLTGAVDPSVSLYWNTGMVPLSPKSSFVICQGSELHISRRSDIPKFWLILSLYINVSKLFLLLATLDR